MLSEPLVLREGMGQPPPPLTLLTDEGPQAFPVLAVFYDYASDRGSILISRNLYEAWWPAPQVTSAGIFVDATTDADALATALAEQFQGRSDVIVQSNAVIGAEGYGFAQDERGRSHRIPQLGRVVIEDRVSVGAGSCIDRATYGETRIGAGTKLDNLCHIAHNVEIGQDCLLTAAFVVAGSTKIGDRVVASGQVGVLDHLEICDDVFLVHRAGVVDDIDVPGIYAGLPLQPYPSYLKTAAVLRRLSDLREKVRKLERRLSGR